MLVVDTNLQRPAHRHMLQVKELGFKSGLGLWCAPFWIPNLPSWKEQYGHCCLKDANGQPIVGASIYTPWHAVAAVMCTTNLWHSAAASILQIRIAVCVWALNASVVVLTNTLLCKMCTRAGTKGRGVAFHHAASDGRVPAA